MPIDANYKSHDIHVTAFELPATREWEPRITICWSEGSYIMIKLPDIAPKHFSTREEAENYASAFAKKWIDDGKPSFHDGGRAPASE